MRLSIRHETLYRYGGPISFACQLIRQTPLNTERQSVRQWTVRTFPGGPMAPDFDAFGNRFHLKTVLEPFETLSILAEGIVDTENCGTNQTLGNETMPARLFLRTTPLTAPSEVLRALAYEAQGGGTAETIDRLARLVHERIAFCFGATGVMTTADAAFAAGAGVCQDHAHVMIACARIIGIPARYVSGYLWTDTGAQASHAWVEVFRPDAGWIGIDPANNTPVTPAHVRVAVGLDYETAGPVRGIRRGGDLETLEANVRIDRLDWSPGLTV